MTALATFTPERVLVLMEWKHRSIWNGYTLMGYELTSTPITLPGISEALISFFKHSRGQKLSAKETEVLGLQCNLIAG